MVDYKLDTKKTALIVFDMLNDFIQPGAPLENPDVRENLIPRLKKLIEACRSKGIPVIYACHGHRKDGSDAGLMAEIYASVRERRALVRGTPGVEVYEEIKPQEGDVVIEKHRYSAFYNTDLEIILRNKGVDTLIITGASTNVGCETTARDATNRDYKVIFPSDGNVARDLPDMGWGAIPKEEVQRVVLTSLAHAFARVMTIEEIMRELQ
jgi:ureidoacrylate peracid hydrolase